MKPPNIPLPVVCSQIASWTALAGPGYFRGVCHRCHSEISVNRRLLEAHEVAGVERVELCVSCWTVQDQLDVLRYRNF